MHVMMQPAVADKLFGDSMLDGIGLLARVLLVAPDTTVGTRLFREVGTACDAALDDYNGRLLALMWRAPAMKPGEADVLDPPVLRFSGDARSLFVQFHDAVERDLAVGGKLHLIRAFGAKMAEHAGRLAAVLSTYVDPEAMDVHGDAMACGIELVKHYALEMLRLKGAATVSPDLRLAARLLSWWQGRSDPRCHLAAIYQRGPNAISTAAKARQIVSILEEHGWIRRLAARTELDGAPHADAWELVP